MRHHAHLLRALLVTLALCFGLTGTAIAQEITGSIVGTVKDANGAVVKGATVTVTDNGTKLVVRTAETNDDGAYTVRDLPVTTYDVSVEAPNFKKHIESKVQVDVGKRRTVDITLEAGNVSEVVTVEATPLAVELGLSKTIAPEFLKDAHHWLVLHGRYVCTARKPHYRSFMRCRTVCR